MHSKASQHIINIAVLAVMTALAVVCSGQFPYGLTVRVGEFIKISPIFVIIGVVAATYGVWESALVAFLSDLIQSLTAGLGVSFALLIINTLIGLCFGFLLRKPNLLKIIISVLLTQIIGSLILITAVLCIRYGMNFKAIILWRVLQTVIMICVEIPVLKLLLINTNLPQKLKSNN